MAINMTNPQDETLNWQSVLKPRHWGDSETQAESPAHSKVNFLKRKKQWETLFEGFSSLRGITYVTSPGFLLEIFTEMGYEKVDLLIGDGLADTYKESLDGHLGLIEHLYDESRKVRCESDHQKRQSTRNYTFLNLMKRHELSVDHQT